MDKITDLRTAVAYIRSRSDGHRDLGSITVARKAYDKICADLKDLSLVKDSPRPTYGPPYGDIDRLLWDEKQATQKLAQVRILGVLVLRAVANRGTGLVAGRQKERPT